MSQELLRKLPAVDRLLHLPEVAALAEKHGHERVVLLLRAELEALRAAILGGSENFAEDDPASVLVASLRRRLLPSMRHAINAAGVVLHTGLGRAMLAEEAVAAVHDVAKGYCTLAADLNAGKRMSRDVHLKDLLCAITGAGSATFANNNAAATMLVLNTLARGKEVIISRGQLVEIGGAFRMPEVMEMSGAIMREIGTTNKTHLRDYERAINENTGALIRVHQSNYRIVGFTQEPGIEELCELGRKHNLPVIDDLGSGALVDLRAYGLDYEPLVQASIQAGVEVACFSGDKLIGGPQSGVMVGTTQTIEAIKKNPLARALRIDKLTVAALEATCKLFFDKSHLNERHPTYRMFAIQPDTLQQIAEQMASQVGNGTEVVAGETEVGSGSVPTQTLPTWLVSVRPRQGTAESFARRLRHYDPPIYARIAREAVLLDPRTIQPDEVATVVTALRALLTGDAE